ncbi:MAG: ribbon-helix-helix protein, CopG family [Cyanobacteria bacterium J06650_10]
MQKPLIAGRIPTAWMAQIEEIQEETGQSQSEIVQAAIALYLSKTDPNSVMSMSRRLAKLERQYNKLVQLS